MIENKKTFKVTVNGKELDLAVIRPNRKHQTDAAKVHSKAFKEAVEAGCILRAKIADVMKEQGLWDDKKEAQEQALRKELAECEKKLLKGGIKLWTDARDTAIKMRTKRFELQQLLAKRDELDLNTAEAQAENTKFNYLVSACTVYSDTGKPYFKDLDDYLNSEDEVGIKAASTLGKMIWGLEDDFANKLPENAFLIKHKMVNDKLHLVNKEGKLVNAEGKLVDELGRLVNEKNEPVDEEGTPLDANGEYKIETAPFLDEEGKPIVEQ